MLLIEIKNKDFISLDSVGYAQVGARDYSDKIFVEKKVIDAYFKDSMRLAVPLNFTRYAFFKWEECTHEIGNYFDFRIIYDLDYINYLEENDILELLTEFWDWIERCEKALSEASEELLLKCQKLYEL